MSINPKETPAYASANYYYLSNKVIFGPITAQQVQELYKANSILPTDGIWIDSIEGNGIPLQETELGQRLLNNLPLPRVAKKFNSVTEGMLQPLQARPQFLPLAEEALPRGTYRPTNLIYSDLAITSSLLLIMLAISIGLSIALFVTHGLNNSPPTSTVATNRSLPADTDFETYQQSFNRNQQPPPQASPSTTGKNDLLGKYVLLASLAFSLLTMLTYFVWLYQAFQNVYALGATGLNFTPGWAVGCHFVPLLNLWKPFQALHQLCRASTNARTWQDPNPTPLAGAFWLFFWLQTLFVSFAVQKYTQAAMTSNPALLNDAATCFQIASITGILCMLSLGGIVLDVTKRQNKQSKPNTSEWLDQSPRMGRRGE